VFLPVAINFLTSVFVLPPAFDLIYYYLFLYYLVPPDVSTTPVFTWSSSESVTAVHGHDLTLECAAVGWPVPRITWEKYGGHLPPGRFSLIFGNTSATFNSLKCLCFLFIIVVNLQLGYHEVGSFNPAGANLLPIIITN